MVLVLGSGEKDFYNPTLLSRKGDKFCMKLRCHKIKKQEGHLSVGSTNDNTGSTEEGGFASVWSDKEGRRRVGWI